MKGRTVKEMWHIKIINPCLLFFFILQVTDLTMIYCLLFLDSYHNSVVLHECCVVIKLSL